MGKVEMGPQMMVPVRPVFLLGVLVGGKVNFMEIGGGGTVANDPLMIALPVGHERYSLQGILQNRIFSVNIPTVELVVETDYCGMASGRDTDKARDCGFEVFYGKLKTAPMIAQCVINMECSVAHLLGSKTHTIVIGKVENTYVSEDYMKDGQPAFENLHPLLWFRNKASYVSTGKTYGKSRETGKTLKIRK